MTEEIKPKILLINGEITWETVSLLVEKLYFSYFGKEQIRHYLICILSPGGDVDAAWSLYAVLKNLDAQIHTVATGRVYSSAVIPFLAGQQRYAFPESVFLFHPATISHSANEEVALYRYHEEIQGEKYDRHTFRTVLNNIKGTNKKHIDELIHDSKSSFISATKAKKYKIVTKIINRLEKVTYK